MSPSELERLARSGGKATAAPPRETEWWPAASMVVNAMAAGVTPDMLREISWRTLLHIDRIASAWQRASSQNAQDAPRKATQADIRSILQ